MGFNIAVLPGDGIGKEIIAEAMKVLTFLDDQGIVSLEIEQAAIGGSAYEQYKTPLPEATLNIAKVADGILLGAVGGPQWENIGRNLRPEEGLLSLRSELALFANLRPAIMYDELIHASSLKQHIVANLDIMIVRELTGGIYFGQPRGIQTNEAGVREGYNTLRYSEQEIENIARVGFEMALLRNKKLCSVDKANVLEVSQLWREVVERIKLEYPEVALQHLYVDNAAMQLVREPKQFDVILTGNMFGDILSDCAAMLTGSIGMLPSASLDRYQKGMYEPIHGSAPDIAGHNIANPLATILSVAMMFRHSFALPDIAKAIEQSIEKTLQQGYRTKDIQQAGKTMVSTREMGDRVVHNLTEVYHHRGVYA